MPCPSSRDGAFCVFVYYSPNLLSHKDKILNTALCKIV